jgi:glycosyltransferase involved in cell wall biosynthesis
MVTTIHGFSSRLIIPVYKKYNSTSHYVSISFADRAPELKYIANIYHGLCVGGFPFNEQPADYLLYFGRIHPDKGTAEAIAIAKSSNRRLIIAGIIQDENYFTEKIKPLLNEQIQYVGHADPEKRNELLGNASALLHPIQFREPFGLSVVESMLCGTPVIAFNKGSMPELIKNGKTGFLVDNVDEAVEAVGQLHRISRPNCHDHASAAFSLEKMIDSYVSVYQQVLAH